MSSKAAFPRLGHVFTAHQKWRLCMWHFGPFVAYVGQGLYAGSWQRALARGSHPGIGTSSLVVQERQPPDPTLAVNSCLRERLTASNHVLLPCAQGCQTIALHPPALRQFWLHDDARLCRLVLPSDIALADALRTLGVDILAELEGPYEQAAVPFVPNGLPPSQDAGILEVPALPFLTLCGIDTSESAIASGIQPPAFMWSSGHTTVDSSDGMLARPCLILCPTACFLLERECMLHLRPDVDSDVGYSLQIVSAPYASRSDCHQCRLLDPTSSSRLLLSVCNCRAMPFLHCWLICLLPELWNAGHGLSGSLLT